LCKCEDFPHSICLFLSSDMQHSTALLWIRQLLTSVFSFIFHAYNIDSIFCNIFHFCFLFKAFFLLAFFKSDCELIDAKYSENIPIMKQIFVSIVFCAEMFKIQRQIEFDEFLFVFLVFIRKRIETFSFSVPKRILFMLVCYRKIN